MATLTTTNPYVNNFFQPEEQSLVEDLIVESIQFYGLEIVYVPRQYVSLDRFYGEDPSSLFSKSYRVECFVKNIDGYQGDSDFISKFGLEIQNEGTINIAIRRFREQIIEPFKTATGKDIIRPREGDLIYFPIDKRIFEITRTEDKMVFFQLGSLYMYDIRVRQFEMSGQSLETGNDAIDSIEDLHDYRFTMQLTSGTGEYLPGEVVSVAGTGFRAKVAAFDGSLGMLDCINQQGEIPLSGILVGEISSAAWQLDETSDPSLNTNESVIDNDVVKDEIPGLLNMQSNPLFGG